MTSRTRQQQARLDHLRRELARAPKRHHGYWQAQIDALLRVMPAEPCDDFHPAKRPELVE